MALRVKLRMNLLVAAGLTATALVACSDDAVDVDGSRQHPAAGAEVVRRVAVDPTAVSPPKSSVAPGVVVVTGSSLIGPTFPLLGWTDDGGRLVVGWQALVTVDGDPVDVWNGYVEQFGIGDRASADHACIVSRRGTTRSTESDHGDQDYPTRHRFLTEGAVDGEDRFECLAMFDQVELQMAVGQDGCAAMLGTQEPSSCVGHEIAHLHIRVQTEPGHPVAYSADGALGTDQLRFDRTDDADLGRGPAGLAPIPPGDVVPPSLGTPQPSRLPTPGERIDDGLDYFLDQVDGPPNGLLVVPPGGSSLVAPAVLGYCNSGLVAVVSVPLLPEQAVGSFGLFGDMRTSAKDSADPAWAVMSADAAGGYHLELLALEQPDGTSAVLATECGD